VLDLLDEHLPDGEGDAALGRRTIRRAGRFRDLRGIVRAAGLLDALNGIAFEDDRQVVELVARKPSGRSPQTAITITEVRP
jgi:Holliday junction resolvase RusA-like endonuclease